MLMCTPTHQGLSESTKSAKCTMVWVGGDLKSQYDKQNIQKKGCVTLWPCHLH
jgi:hypothetical protein